VAGCRAARKALLESQGYAVVGAADGREALALLRGGGFRPGLIILDLTMPVMDGWEFRAAQLDDAELASIPVMVFSAHHAARQAAGTLGAVTALAKPLDVDELLRVVGAYCVGEAHPAPPERRLPRRAAGRVHGCAIWRPCAPSLRPRSRFPGIALAA